MPNQIVEWNYWPPESKKAQQLFADIWWPPGFLLVPEAVIKVGQATYNDEWTGEEFDARAVGEPPAKGAALSFSERFVPRSYDNFWKVLTASGYRRVNSEDEAKALWRSELPKLTDMWRKEYGAWERCEKVIRRLKDALYDKAFQAEGHRLEFGDCLPVAFEFWGSEKADQVWRNTTPIMFPVGSGFLAGHFIEGRILINAAGIEAYLSGNVSSKTTGTQKTVTKRKIGRPKKSGGLSVADEPLVLRMHTLIEDTPDLSPWAAAQQIVDDAKGGGTEESRITRLVRRYNDSLSESERK